MEAFHDVITRVFWLTTLVGLVASWFSPVLLMLNKPMNKVALVNRNFAHLKDQAEVQHGTCVLLVLFQACVYLQISAWGSALNWGTSAVGIILTLSTSFIVSSILVSNYKIKNLCNWILSEN